MYVCMYMYMKVFTFYRYSFAVKSFALVEKQQFDYCFFAPHYYDHRCTLSQRKVSDVLSIVVKIFFLSLLSLAKLVFEASCLQYLCDSFCHQMQKMSSLDCCHAAGVLTP